MVRFTGRLLAAVCATVVLAAVLAGVARGATLRIATGSTVASVGFITLRDSTLGNVGGFVTLTATFITTAITCDLFRTAVVGGVAGSNTVISTPSGVTTRGLDPRPIVAKCPPLPDGSLELRIVPRFTLFVGGTVMTFGLVGTPVGVGVRLGATGATAVQFDGGSIGSDVSSVANYILPAAVSLRPAVSWAYIP